MNKDEVLKDVSELIADNPESLADLFKLVSDNFYRMQKAQAERRESKHRYALQEMLDNTWSLAMYKKKAPRLFTNLECCTLLEACDAIVPDGKGGSNAQSELLAHLAKSCRALGWKPTDKFITEIRHKKSFLSNLYKSNPTTNKETV